MPTPSLKLQLMVASIYTSVVCWWWRMNGTHTESPVQLLWESIVGVLLADFSRFVDWLLCAFLV